MCSTRSICSCVIGLAVAVTLWAVVLHVSATRDAPAADSVRAPANIARDAASSGESPPSRALAVPATPPLSPDERDTVEWAQSRFSLVGLDLPDVEITFHDDTQYCGGLAGIYRGNHHHRRIRICVPDWGTFGSALHRQRTLVHELAHAWEQANLDDHGRMQLLRILGAEDWYAPEAAWEQRGAERFAETIVWGLYDQLRRPTLIDVSCQDLHGDFRAITGKRALGPLEKVCELGAPSSDVTREGL